MNNKQNKKNIFKRIVAFIGATFTAIACCFLLNKPNENINVYADTVDNYYSFEGSDLHYMNCYVKNSGSELPSLYTVCFGVSLYAKPNNITNLQIDFYYINRGTSSVENIDYNHCTPYYYQESDGQNILTDVNTRPDEVVFFKLFPDGLIADNNFTSYFPLICKQVGNFNCNVQYVRLYLTPFNDSVHPSWDYFNYFNCKIINVEYFDNNGNSYLIQTYCPQNYKFDDRVYYFSNAFKDVDGYTVGYRQGESDGFESGLVSGRNEGYKNGYNVGKNEGYNLGYNEGLDGSGRWSFNNLLTSVIDVPLKAFTSLFNFEILGVNLSGFFLGLLTCCIVIGIIRFIL